MPQTKLIGFARGVRLCTTAPNTDSLLMNTENPYL